MVAIVFGFHVFQTYHLDGFCLMMLNSKCCSKFILALNDTTCFCLLFMVKYGLFCSQEMILHAKLMALVFCSRQDKAFCVSSYDAKGPQLCLGHFF